MCGSKYVGEGGTCNMVRILSILFLFISCNVDNKPVSYQLDSVVIVFPPADTIAIPVDSSISYGRRLIVFTDTAYKTKIIFTDTVYKTKIMFSDTAYKTKVLFSDTAYKTKIVYLPIYLPEYLRESVQSGTVKFTITYK